jgi:hypothetical protein
MRGRFKTSWVLRAEWEDSRPGGFFDPTEDQIDCKS